MIAEGKTIKIIAAAKAVPPAAAVDAAVEAVFVKLAARPASWPRRSCFSEGRVRNAFTCENMSVRPPSPG